MQIVISYLVNKTRLSTWTMRDVQTLTGKVAIVTGGTRGIGLYTAMGLATVGAEVIILGSNPEQGGNAVSFIKKRVPRANISFTKVDFGSLQGIADFARYLCTIIHANFLYISLRIW